MAGRELLALPGHHAAEETSRTLLQLLRDNAEQFGDRPAVEDIEGHCLTHAGLYQQVSDTVAVLQAAGLGRSAVVLVILPNGPLALTAILSVAAVAVALPVGIEEPTQALSAVMRQSGATAILFDRRHAAKAEALCADHDVVPLAIEATQGAEPGRFSLGDVGDVGGGPRRAEPSRPDDASILARTAGTGRAARLVAWSQVSLYRSAEVFAEWAGLSTGDRSLCMMPFAHMHSLVRSCLPVLMRGGAAICGPGFDRSHALNWLRRCRPTFMTAVPSIYRTMVDAATAPSEVEAAADTSLRFVAVGSDRMDQATVARLAAAFQVPVREFYGMSEVSPMLAATRPGMSAQEGGAVGEVVPVWQVFIRGDDGASLPSGEEGEICARGGLLNPVLGGRATGGSETEGWYRTGDLGFFDAGGRLHVTGRVDDRIVRGGKKIAPAAVETVLGTHPDVDQSVVFPIPEDGLGQVVGAAVVPRRGCSPSVAGLRAYLADRLADYMVPEHLVLLDELPKSASGKVSRHALAEALGLPGPADVAPGGSGTQRFQPRSETEKEILRMVCGLLERDRVDLVSDISELGCDSFLATSLLVAIEERFEVMPEPGEFLANGSVEGLARLVDRLRAESEIDFIVKLQQGTYPIPLFITHGPGGNAIYATRIAKALGEQQTVYVYRHRGEQGDVVEAMEVHAARFVRAMQTIQPAGPFCLAGHSFGAQLAFEVAQQLTVAGRDVAFLGLIDDEADLFKRKFGAARVTGRPRDTNTYFRRMLDCYVTRPYAGDIALFVASPPPVESLADPTLGWGELATGEVVRLTTSGDHRSMMSAQSIKHWIGVFRDQMALALDRHHAQPGLLQRHLEARAALIDRPDVAATLEARSAARRGELEAEIKAYRRAIQGGREQSYWVYRNLGLALEQSGRVDEALGYLSVAAQRESIPVIGMTILARKLHKHGRRRGARSILQQVESAAAEDPFAHEVCGAAWRAIGSAEQATRCFQQSLRLRPDNPSAEKALADTLVNRRLYKEAEKVIDTLLTKYPDRVDFHRILGSLQRARGDTEAAESTLRRALLQDPTKPILYHELSKVLNAQGDLEEAIRFARQATDRLPNNARFQVWHGMLLQKQGNREAASLVFRLAKELNPGLFTARQRFFRTVWVVGQRLRFSRQP